MGGEEVDGVVTPVVDKPQVAANLDCAPKAIARATSALAAPNSSRSSGETFKSLIFKRFE